jgi:hypothetical protein
VLHEADAQDQLQAFRATTRTGLVGIAGGRRLGEFTPGYDLVTLIPPVKIPAR